MDSLRQVVQEVVRTLGDVVKNATATATAGGTKDPTGPTTVNHTDSSGAVKFQGTPEGILTAYVSIVIMALIPIIVGSLKSVSHHKTQQKESKESGEAPETMTSKDAMKFPLIASGALLGLYVLFKVFSKDNINLLMTWYFMSLGIFAMSHLLAPFLRRFFSSFVTNPSYHLQLIKRLGKSSSHLIDFQFDTMDINACVASTGLAVWYLMKKHWIANNLIGMAFAANGVELLQLNSVTTGCILLAGLFFYDIFWVFGTDVMVTVARSFDAPIKLVFPQDFLEHGIFGTKMSMLGLGDIVIPGIFIALLLRFDKSLKRGSNTYFNTCFLAYLVGIVAALVVMTVYKHAQPVLLYLVPTCISFPVTLATLKGDLKRMFSYEDHPSGDGNGKNKSKKNGAVGVNDKKQAEKKKTK